MRMLVGDCVKARAVSWAERIVGESRTIERAGKDREPFLWYVGRGKDA